LEGSNTISSPPVFSIGFPVIISLLAYMIPSLDVWFVSTVALFISNSLFVWSYATSDNDGAVCVIT